jgi:hypothetical protein
LPHLSRQDVPFSPQNLVHTSHLLLDIQI